MAEVRVEELKTLRIDGRRHELPIEVARYWPHNRIIWAGPETAPEPLVRVVDSIVQELRAMNFRTEARQFAAHVTLIRNARTTAQLPPLPRIRWNVDEVVLVESRPVARGREYGVLQRYALT